MKVFVDSDVVVSAIISSEGVSHLLLHTQEINPVISSVSHKELSIVLKRLNLKVNKLDDLLNKSLQKIALHDTVQELKIKYGKYVLDQNDAHIVAGASLAKAEFLITYNVRHFKIDKIKEDLNIIILTPGMLLQHLRSV